MQYNNYTLIFIALHISATLWQALWHSHPDISRRKKSFYQRQRNWNTNNHSKPHCTDMIIGKTIKSIYRSESFTFKNNPPKRLCRNSQFKHLYVVPKPSWKHACAMLQYGDTLRAQIWLKCVISDKVMAKVIFKVAKLHSNIILSHNLFMFVLCDGSSLRGTCNRDQKSNTNTS